VVHPSVENSTKKSKRENQYKKEQMEIKKNGGENKAHLNKLNSVFTTRGPIHPYNLFIDFGR
jgi:hypothetical protein